MLTAGAPPRRIATAFVAGAAGAGALTTGRGADPHVGAVVGGLGPDAARSEQPAGEAGRSGTGGEGRLAGLDVVGTRAAGQEVVVLLRDRVGRQGRFATPLSMMLFLMIAADRRAAALGRIVAHHAVR